MFSNFNGINPYFFTGVVVDKRDPINEGRVKVHAFGVHPTESNIKNLDQLNTVDLEDYPWAICMSGTYGVLQTIPEEGDWVFGLFLDGREAQHPMILGGLPGMNAEDYSDPSGSQALGNPNNPNYDPRESPQGPADSGDADPSRPSNVQAIAELEADPEWNASMDRILSEHPGLTKDELYRIIQGESGFDSTITNGYGSGATGLFQFMPATARGLGTTTGEIQNMSPAQQLDLYSSYLSQNNYRGGPLGIMQAAPAYANRPGNTVIYPIGSKAWEQNPVWRTAGGGGITVDSINEYYANKG